MASRQTGQIQIVLLRGINIGSRNRIAMPALRDALEDAGFEDVRTYVQSGNVVLSSKTQPEQAGRKVGQAIAETFGLEIPAIVRTRAELARVAKLDPLGKVAKDPKRYQVTFLSAKLEAEAVKKLEDAAAPTECFAVHGREVYAWHPAGVARSKLWALLAGDKLGVTATSRNWTTVAKLLELARS
jgi:uncharacterized protein (DUF1697 family)